MDRLKTFMVSLKDVYYQRILDGTKKYEFRRKFANISEPFYCFIYLSSPVQEVQAMILFGKPIVDFPSRTLEMAEREGYPYVKSLVDYFGDREVVYSLPVEAIYLLNSPKKLSELKERFNFYPPQSFYNLENNQFMKLKEYLLKDGTTLYEING